MPIIVLRLICDTVSFAELSRLWSPFRAVSSLRRAPASPAAAGVTDPPAQRRSACARPWCRHLRSDLRPRERSGAFATDRAYLFASFFRYVFSDLHPMGGVGYPAGVDAVCACTGRCVLVSGRKLKRRE